MKTINYYLPLCVCVSVCVHVCVCECECVWTSLTMNHSWLCRMRHFFYIAPRVSSSYPTRVYNYFNSKKFMITIFLWYSWPGTRSNLFNLNHWISELLFYYFTYHKEARNKGCSDIMYVTIEYLNHSTIFPQTGREVAWLYCDWEIWVTSEELELSRSYDILLLYIIL